MNAVRRPELVIDAFAANDALGYLRDLFFPYAFIPLAGPLAASVALPQFVANMLSLQLTSNLHAHYVAVPLAASSLALVEGFARIRRLALRRFALAAVAVTSAITSTLWGLLPWGIPHDQGHWALTPNSRAHVMRTAVSYPGPDDAVVATYNLVPHLTQRRQIFTFPNPWIATNWGTGIEPTPDPDVVDWLLIDRQLLGEMSDDFEQILADEKWEIVYEREDVVVAKRGP